VYVCRFGCVLFCPKPVYSQHWRSPLYSFVPERCSAPQEIVIFLFSLIPIPLRMYHIYAAAGEPGSCNFSSHSCWKPPWWSPLSLFRSRRQNGQGVTNVIIICSAIQDPVRHLVINHRECNWFRKLPTHPRGYLQSSSYFFSSTLTRECERKDSQLVRTKARWQTVYLFHV
jgi:hypothetical protein